MPRNHSSGIAPATKKATLTKGGGLAHLVLGRLGLLRMKTSNTRIRRTDRKPHPPRRGKSKTIDRHRHQRTRRRTAPMEEQPPLPTVWDRKVNPTCMHHLSLVVIFLRQSTVVQPISLEYQCRGQRSGRSVRKSAQQELQQAHRGHHTGLFRPVSRRQKRKRIVQQHQRLLNKPLVTLPLFCLIILISYRHF